MSGLNLEDLKFIEQKDILGACIRLIDIGHSDILSSTIINGRSYFLFTYSFYVDDKVLVFDESQKYIVIDRKNNKEVFRLEFCSNPKKEEGSFIEEEEYFTNGSTMQHNVGYKVHNFEKGDWLDHLLNLDDIICRCGEKRKDCKPIINRLSPLTEKLDWAPILAEKDSN